MSEFCTCSETLLNTGAPGKQRIVNAGTKIIIVPTKADDGTLNVISSSDVLDQTYFDAKVSHADPSKRWYPLKPFTQVESTRGEPARETYNDGSSAVLIQGVKTYMGWLVDFSPKFIDNLKSFRCIDFSVYLVDNCGSLRGSVSKDGTTLKPFRIFNQSWYPYFEEEVIGSSRPRVALTFEFSQLERDEYIRVIPADQVDADLLTLEGLLELKAPLDGAATVTGFTFDLFVDYDIFEDANQSRVAGWVANDFTFYNESTASAIVPTSVTEVSDGKYTTVFAAQTASDVVRVNNDLTQKPGFFLEEKITLA